jgi:CRP-like cAMP-binding protein
MKKIDQNNVIAAQRRLNAAISLSAEEHYHELEKKYPKFLQRFPQHVIASYLGVNRETLSRIRRRPMKK